MKTILDIQNQFGHHLFNFIKGKVSAVEDAQDIYHDVIVKIMTKSGQLDNQESLKSWIFSTANNQIIDYYRKQKPVPDSELIESLTTGDQENQNGYHELAGCLNGFINQLPSDDKEIILLSEIEGRSQKDIAGQLNMNYTTVRSKVQRGREKIKKLIYKACEISLDLTGSPMDCIPKSKTASCEKQPNQEGCN